MFDANMRYLPKGLEFFSLCRGVRDPSPLVEHTNYGELIICTMLSDDHENPVVRFHFGDSYIDVSDSESGFSPWFVYAGCKDGTDFINDNERNKAAYMLRVLDDGYIKGEDYEQPKTSTI